MLDEQNARWQELNEKELPALNESLKPQHLRTLSIRATRGDRALGQINRPLELGNNKKSKISTLVHELQAGDCRMAPNSQLIFNIDGTGKLVSWVRSDAHWGMDVWHQRFSINDMGGQELFRIPPGTTIFGYPQWWNRDVGSFVVNGDVWVANHWEVSFTFPVEYWDRMTYVVWIADC